VSAREWDLTVVVSAAESLAQAREAERVARDDLHGAIRGAREDGVTLRAIAEAAGMTAERVRQVCRD